MLAAQAKALAALADKAAQDSEKGISTPVEAITHAEAERRRKAAEVEAAKEQAAARVIMTRLRKHLARKHERAEHAKLPLSILWRQYCDKATGRKKSPMVCGPIVEIVFAFQGQARRLRKAKVRFCLFSD